MNGVASGAHAWMYLLLGTELKAVALLALCALGAVVLRRSSAAGRHWMWLLGMMGLLALPLLQVAGPRWATLPAWTSTATATASSQSPATFPPTAAQATRGRVMSAFGESGAPPSAASGGHASGVEPRSGDAASEASAASRVVTELPRIPWSLALLGVWIVGTLLLLVSIARSLLATRRLALRSVSFPRGPVTDTARQLAGDLRLRRTIRILRGDAHAMPMSWGWVRPVVLLPAGAELWSRARLETVLRHELAHVRRADCLTQVAAEIVLAFHWVNPLAWLATYRLRVEREYACDDMVLSAGTRASEYADELLALARAFRAGRSTALAAVAMARPARLSHRLRAVLDGTRSRRLGRLRAAGAGALAAGLVMALAALKPAPPPPAPPTVPHVTAVPAVPARATSAPSTPAPPPDAAATDEAARRGRTPSLDATLPQSTSCGTDTGGWKNISSNSRDHHRRVEWSKPGCDVEVRLDGRVRFNADFTDVASMDRDARLRIDEQDGSTERMLDITPGDEGKPVYAYSVNRKEQAFDGTARAWYRGMLLQLFRRTGFMAHERVAALLKQGGVPAVVRELDALTSDYVFAKYSEELLKQAKLSDAQALQVVKRARTRVHSDYYLASILRAFARKHLTSDAMLNEYVAAAGTIDSDYYRTQVLKTALDHGHLTTAQVASTLKAASHMTSDYYLTEVLTDVVKQYGLAPDLKSVYLNAVGSIGSDYYRAQALEKLLEKDTLSEAQTADVVATAAKIGSDYYKAQVLLKVLHRYHVQGATRQAVVDAMNTIESKYYRGRVALALLKK